MQKLPYDYHVTANAEAEGNVILKAEAVPQLVTAPCPGSDEPADQWCPEMLLVAAVTDSLVLGFRTIARTSQFDWQAISCRAAGTLDRVDKVNRFTSFRVDATLTVPRGADADKARRLMEKAQAACVIANSLTGQIRLEIEIAEE